MKSKLICRTIDRHQLGKRLDKILVRLFPNYSRTKIQSFITGGLVTIDEKVKNVSKEKIFNSGLIKIRIPFHTNTNYIAKNIPLNVVYEDKDILIINKQKNIIVHPGVENSSSTILNSLLYHYPYIKSVHRAGIVHRLDKNTTGIMMIAKNQLTQNKLIQLIKYRKIKKEYESIVFGVIQSDGFINQPIARHPKKRKIMSVVHDGKQAITNYSIIEKFRFHTWIRIHTKTGRTHQIRVHMSYINHPVVGDQTYGKNRIPKKISTNLKNILSTFNRQALHATAIEIFHPTKLKKIKWESALPEDMQLLIEELRKDKNVHQSFHKKLK